MSAKSNLAIYPGSFDPITLGHVDIIRRIQPILGHVRLVISHHSAKKYLFSAEERKRLAEEALSVAFGEAFGEEAPVTVDIHEGLTVDYARDAGAKVIVRGLRAVTDFEYELVMANMNKKLNPSIETMIVFAAPEFYYVASSTVKEVAMHGGSVKGLVPANVEKALKALYKQAGKKTRAKSGSVDSQPDKQMKFDEQINQSTAEGSRRVRTPTKAPTRSRRKK